MPISKDELIRMIDDPHVMERSYREQRTAFRAAFREAYPEISAHPVARVWNERFRYESESVVTWGTRMDWLRVIALCLVAGTIAKIPKLFSINEEFFFTRNITFIVFPLLTAYFSWKNGFRVKRLVSIGILFAVSAVYMNLLPDNKTSDTLALACVHLALVSWTLLGVGFSGSRDYSHESRLDFLKYFGDLVVMNALLALAFGLFSALTIGLFGVIGLRIEEFYFQYVIVYALASAPILSTHLVRTNPQLVNKVSPVIARVFTPLLLVTLTIYLIAWIGSGKDPYNDRDFLFVFNMLLLGVMAVIFFSVVETAQSGDSRFGRWILLALSVVAIVVNGVALSAIIFRITSWGFTPNRLAVIGSNLLMAGTLITLSYRIYRSIFHRAPVGEVSSGITLFLPAFGIWAFIVTFLFPLIFGFR